MSMINEQVKGLREIATNWNPNVPINPVSVVLNKAADTIKNGLEILNKRMKSTRLLHGNCYLNHTTAQLWNAWRKKKNRVRKCLF